MSKNNVTQSINNKHTEDNSNQIRQSISAKHRFEANHNYFVISIYALSVIILSALAIYLIWHFNIISGHISNFLRIASDFIIAFFIAYFINPIVKLIYKYVFVKLIKIKKHQPRSSCAYKIGTSNARSGVRTLDTLIKSQVLYQLS